MNIQNIIKRNGANKPRWRTPADDYVKFQAKRGVKVQADELDDAVLFRRCLIRRCGVCCDRMARQ